MKLVIQRISKAKVTSDSGHSASIGRGLLVLVGIETADTLDDVEWLAAKTVNMRIFADNDGLMNLSVMDVAGEIMIVSQFTLHARVKKGNRPAFVDAAPPEQALPLYESLISDISLLTGKMPATGVFGANMQIKLINDGPVTIIIDSKNKI